MTSPNLIWKVVLLLMLWPWMSEREILTRPAWLVSIDIAFFKMNFQTPKKNRIFFSFFPSLVKELRTPYLQGFQQKISERPSPPPPIGIRETNQGWLSCYGCIEVALKLSRPHSLHFSDWWACSSKVKGNDELELTWPTLCKQKNPVNKIKGL